jgi:Coenzyme PQQ synthesis protein D (PqqD)
MSDPIISASPDHVFGDLNGETILLSSTTNMYYGLDPVGSRIWELIQEPRRMSAICEHLVSEFDVDPVKCEHDTQQLIQKMAEVNLVTIKA